MLNCFSGILGATGTLASKPRNTPKILYLTAVRAADVKNPAKARAGQVTIDIARKKKPKLPRVVSLFQPTMSAYMTTGGPLKLTAPLVKPAPKPASTPKGRDSLCLSDGTKKCCQSI